MLIFYIFCYTNIFLDPIVINTSQNVVIDYEPAGLGNRLLAGILDFLFKFAFIITVAIIIMLIYSSTNQFSSEKTGDYTFLIIGLMTYISYLLYDFLFETFMQGQTFGKKIMKIKVVKLDGTQPTVGSYLLRWLIRLFEIDMCGGLIAIVSIAGSKNSQRLGDMAAGTTIIRVKPAVTLQDTILQQENNEAYQIVFLQVALLSDADTQLIKDVIDFYKTTHNRDSLVKLSAKIKAKTGIVTNLKDEDFMPTLLKDYNHYQLEK